MKPWISSRNRRDHFRSRIFFESHFSVSLFALFTRSNMLLFFYEFYGHKTRRRSPGKVRDHNTHLYALSGPRVKRVITILGLLATLTGKHNARGPPPFSARSFKARLSLSFSREIAALLVCVLAARGPSGGARTLSSLFMGCWQFGQ